MKKEILVFSEKETEWIKQNVAEVMNVWNNGTKEELKEVIGNINGYNLDCVLMLDKTIGDINVSKHVNAVAINYLWDSNMWVWLDNDCTTAEEVNEFIKDDMYCRLYEKIYNFREV